MKKYLTLICVASLFVNASEWCYKGKMLYKYEKGVCVDSVRVDLFLKQLETKQTKERIDVKKFLMELKECK